MGELICFEFAVFCQHRIAQDGDKGETKDERAQGPKASPGKYLTWGPGFC